VISPGQYARRVRPGERYVISHEEGRRYRPHPAVRPGRGYRVLHQDRDLLVIDKEPDLLSVPTSLSDEESLVDRLLEAERRRGVRRPALYAVHRLDRDTSGLILYARTRRALDGLKRQLAARDVERLYVAVATGTVEPERGRFTSRLAEDRRTLKVRSVPPEDRSGREAVTEYEVTERLPEATVLLVRLGTGRKNQIRVHLAEAGHPLVGDRRYGRRSPLVGRAALHARSLAFIHPATGRRARFEAPLPDDLRRLIRQLRVRSGAKLQYPKQPRRTGET
jgi:23S rRNA pseudouridine1911/1915/1917 synthase